MDTVAAERQTPADEDSAEESNRELSLRLHATMVRIREFEKQARNLLLHGVPGFRGPLHDSIGQEAVSAGVITALRSDDIVLSSHRGHGQVIAKGSPVAAAFAELMGRSIGLCGGKGGSMHLASAAHGHYGCSGIIGGQLPIAVGVALVSKLRNQRRVVAPFFGDGTTSIGAFHESVNLASLWQLPVLFVCENNQYTELSRAGDLSPVRNPAADRASAYSLPKMLVDGNDVEAVHAITRKAAAAIRDGGGPLLLEAVTYRINGHSGLDAAKYRPKDEVERWRAQDPIGRHRPVLREHGVPSEEIDELESGTIAVVAAALDEAKAAPHARAEAVLSDLWADGGATWRS